MLIVFNYYSNINIDRQIDNWCRNHFFSVVHIGRWLKSDSHTLYKIISYEDLTGKCNSLVETRRGKETSFHAPAQMLLMWPIFLTTVIYTEAFFYCFLPTDIRSSYRRYSIEKAAIIFKIFWDFLMFDQVFFSPQVKRCAIITYEHGIYEFPHELPNDLRLRILAN